MDGARAERDDTTAITLPVITLCGSMRFQEELTRLEAELTLAGHVVLAPAALPPSGLPPSPGLTAKERARLGRVHLRKVAMADEVLVVNVGGYVGESTRREIEHARSRGITVRFLEAPADDHPADTHADSHADRHADSQSDDRNADDRQQ